MDRRYPQKNNKTDG